MEVHLSQLLRVAALFSMALACACGGNSAPAPVLNDNGALGTLPVAGGAVSVTDPLSRLLGARVEVSAGTLTTPLEVTIARGELPLPAGYIALSVPVRFGPGPAKLTGDARFELPVDFAKLPVNARLGQIDVFRLRPASSDAHAPPFANLRARPERGVVEFLAEELTTYQAAIKADAGTQVVRKYTYRTMAGVSMGATGAASVGFRNHQKFDVIAPLGGYIDWPYFAHFIEKYYLGGFCKAGGTCRVGQDYLGTVAAELPLQPAQDFNNWVANDNGGNFDRDDFLQFFQDFALAYGNLSYYNAASSYWPPGLDQSYSALSRDARCAGPSPVRLSGVCNAEYNPEGRYQAIPVCDGEDGPPIGIYDVTRPHTNPAEVMLAFDVDGDGKRGYAEPVFMNARERFDDVGKDGVPDERETGPLGAYNAVSNPDPAGDNYHWFYNPLGTEKNWMWDAGEPYRDFGLDGVAASAACTADYGEGNGRYDLSPNLQRYFDHSPRPLLPRLTADELGRLRVWIDGGLRDFGGSLVTGQQLAGALAGRGENVRQYRDFRQLTDDPVNQYDFATVDTAKLGRHVLVQYGKPNATAEEIADGDGKHVGTPEQALNRFLSLFRFVDQAMPGGDYERASFGDATSARNETYFSPAVAVCREPGSSACYAPSSRVACATDDGCRTGERCFFGVCRSEPAGSRRSCSGDGNCPSGEMCLRPTCVSRPPSCASSADCTGGTVCEERTCAGDGNCESGETCVYGTCRKAGGSQKTCAQKSDCPGAEICFGDRTYLVVTPPGYNDPANAQKRYPVVYILHGYGQEPRDLAATVFITGGYMSIGTLQKMIFVYPDGKCYLGECKRANWYIDQPAGPDGKTKFAYEKSTLELLDTIDRLYRTKKEELREEVR